MAYEDRDRYADMLAKVRDGISAEMKAATGDTWTVTRKDAENEQHYLELVRVKDGMLVGISVNAYKGRYTMACGAPKDGNGGHVFWSEVAPYNPATFSRAPRPEASCAITDDARKVARDIARRLVPQIEPVWPAFVERISSISETKQRHARALELMATLRATGGTGGGSTHYLNMPCASGRTLALQVRDTGTIEISLSLDPDHNAPGVLRALCAAL